MSKIVKAKFKCSEVTDSGYNKRAKLQAVYGQSGENADFAKATPSGQLEITIDKETPASDFFQPQKEYYISFEEATS